MALMERGPDALRAAKRRKEMDEELKSDPVERSAWGAYPLWRATEWIASDRKVRSKVEDGGGYGRASRGGARNLKTWRGYAQVRDNLQEREH